MAEHRPDPDLLLRQIQEREKREERGHGYFKIFLGYAAGVGKTYTMLEEAQALRKNGRDIIIGLVETHERSETEILRQGLVSVPLHHIEYGGITLKEMNLDAVLERHPEVVLVDELAHTNAPSSRHNKRYQDVEELLDAGISVFTTVNIQHIESLNDTIFQITGVKVEETVPDRIIERANDIKLVDLPIETLFQRLHEGKVYIPEQAQKAMERFFQRGPLLGLRELSLRYTARKVDNEMRSYMVTHAILGPWPAGSRLLVCVSQSPLSERAIRATHQLASDLRAEWFATYVESPSQVLKPMEQEQLSKNLRLIEQLGGKIIILTGERAADEIISFARDNNITLMLVGAPRRSVWRELISGSVVYDLMRRSGSIDMLVVGSSDIKEKIQYQQFTSVKYDWRRIVGSIFLVMSMTAICWILKPGLEFVNIAMLFLIPVIISSILWGRLAGITTSILAVAVLDFFFVKPIFTFSVEDLRYIPSFLVFLIVAIATSVLADNIRRQSVVLRQRERFISAFYSFSKVLVAPEDRSRDENGDEQLLQQAALKIAEIFGCEVMFILPDKENHLKIKTRVSEMTTLADQEMNVTNWVFEHGIPAGKATDSFSSAIWSYLPLKTPQKTLGVLGFRSEDPERILSPEQRRLLEAFINVVALSLERRMLPIERSM